MKSDTNATLIQEAKQGHTDAVRILLENGADVHADNDHALILAAETDTRAQWNYC